jgi:hypothetical protein
MIDRRLKSEIAQGELSDLDRRLHFARSITRFIKSGIKGRFCCFGGFYKLLRRYPSFTLGLRPRCEQTSLAHYFRCGDRLYAQPSASVCIERTCSLRSLWGLQPSKLVSSNSLLAN